MTNSLFENWERQRWKERAWWRDGERVSACCAVWAESGDFPVSQKLQCFGREQLNYKDKGSRDFSGWGGGRGIRKNRNLPDLKRQRGKSGKMQIIITRNLRAMLSLIKSTFMRSYIMNCSAKVFCSESLPMFCDHTFTRRSQILRLRSESSINLTHKPNLQAQSNPHPKLPLVQYIKPGTR